MADIKLTGARYGKDAVRVLRVVRKEGERWHDIVEYNVCALFEGNIATSYTQADNSVVVATDSIKNIVYYLAKNSPHILSAERYALHIGLHVLGKYAHLDKAFIDVEQLRWARIQVPEGGEGLKEHGHAFWRDGEEKRSVKVVVERKAGGGYVTKVVGGVKGLLVIKTTGSAFENFVRDEYTTLIEVNDRIFSTSVDLTYDFAPLDLPEGLAASAKDDSSDASKTLNGAIAIDYLDAAKRSRAATVELFALDESASVQATLYKMAGRIVSENKDIESVSYSLPNKHYIPVDMRYIGVDNLTPANAEVFCPVAAPSGLITATVSRV